MLDLNIAGSKKFNTNIFQVFLNDIFVFCYNTTSSDLIKKKINKNCGCIKQSALKKSITMVRSLAQWTKTLSFPARISPNKNQKESVVNVLPVINTTVTPTQSNSSISQPCQENNKINSMMNSSPISEINQVSCFPLLLNVAKITYKYLIQTLFKY